MLRTILICVLTASTSVLPVSCKPVKPDDAWKDSTLSMVVTSSVFENGAAIPTRYTCSGENVSPAIAWSGAPQSAKAFVITCIDPDAPSGSFRHWVIYDLPPSTASLPEGVSDLPELPDGAKQGLNDFGQIGYGGPCPPPGKPHRYIFHLYALDAPTGVPAGSRIGPVLAAMQTRSRTHIIAEGTLVGTFGR